MFHHEAQRDYLVSTLTHDNQSTTVCNNRSRLPISSHKTLKTRELSGRVLMP